MTQPEWGPRGWDRGPTSASDAIANIRRAARVSQNRAGSVLALLPLIPTLAVVLLVFDVVQLSYVTIVFCAAVGVVVSVVLAREDTRILHLRGFSTALPSPYVAGIAPWLYLCVRGNRLFEADPRSLRPLWQHLGLLIVFLVTVVTLPTFAGIGGMLLEMQ